MNSANEFRFVDYREFKPYGKLNRIVTIGMTEHLGPSNYKTFFDYANEVLLDDGLLLFHAITTPDSQGGRNEWLDKWIFQHSELIHIEQLIPAAHPHFQLRYAEDIQQHYAWTLRAWKKNLEPHWPALLEDDSSGFDEAFKRMQLFYLSSCEAAFLEGAIGVHRIVFSKRGARRLYSFPRWS